MSPLLVALLGALLVPLFVATWRTSLLGLGLQGLLLAAIAYPQLQPLATAHAWLRLVDLVLVRGLLVPLSLYTVLRERDAPARNDAIAPNLFSWTLALGMVLAAFNLSQALVSEAGESQTLVAIAAAGFLLGFLVLASAAGPFSQMVGALRIENAVAVFELAGGHEASLGLQLALLAILVLTIAFFRWYLAALPASEPAPAPEPAPDGATL
jgi:hydrogenase-4 membrane subunit HyfE